MSDGSRWPRRHCSALEIDPGHLDALLNSATVDIDLGHLDTGEAILQKALQIDPRFAEAHALLGQLRLQRGDFGAGWPEYEWRFRCADAQTGRDDALASWDGRADVKRNPVIYAEQGLGDQIMFTSCLPDAIARTGHCVMECDPRLVGLFARSFPQATFSLTIPSPVKLGQRGREARLPGSSRQPAGMVSEAVD